jgi:hypothetical protein
MSTTRNNFLVLKKFKNTITEYKERKWSLNSILFLFWATPKNGFDRVVIKLANFSFA